MSRPIVLKVGGSLLDLPELPQRLRQWLDQPGLPPCVILTGGGALVDAIREHDRIHQIGEARAHALAVRTLDVTAHLLADLVPRTRVVERLAELPSAWSSQVVPVLAPRRWLDGDRHEPGALPHLWDVTSDSIAARLAQVLGASRLILFKSAPSPEGCDLVTASRLGLVDPVFPDAARELPGVYFLNFRDPRSESEGVLLA